MKTPYDTFFSKTHENEASECGVEGSGSHSFLQKLWLWLIVRYALFMILKVKRSNGFLFNVFVRLCDGYKTRYEKETE